MNKLLTTKAVFIAMVLSGCTLAPKYERPLKAVPNAYPTGDAYLTENQGLTAIKASELGWRNFFNDAQLQTLIEIALKNNRDLRVAALNVAAARAQFRVQRGALLPTLDGVGTGTRSRSPAGIFNTASEQGAANAATIGSQYNVGLSASWEVDFFGRVQSLKDAALATYLATAQARKAAEISLIAQVANQYFYVLAINDQLKITRETGAAANESYRLTKVKFDNGAGSELELQQSKGIVETAQSKLAEQMRLRAQAINALVLLVGQSLPDHLPNALLLTEQNRIADLPAGIPSDLLTQRPDIIEAEQKLIAANANIGAARAAFFPRINLTGNLGTVGADLGDLFKPGTLAWSFMPKITLPIFAGGTNVANLDLANIRKNMAIAQYEKTIQTAFKEVADGLAARGTYDQQVEALTRYGASQQRRLDLSQLRYKNGVDSYLNVLTAQTDLYNAQLTLVNAQLARLTSLVTLYQKLGGGWVENSGDAPRPADTLLNNG